MNLILTGFMGTGKSTIGRIVAEQLGREFIDLDTLIETQAGMAISEIFATQGEAVFRQMEHEGCRILAAQGNLVIATGGGALVNADNRHIMESSGLVICLTASPETLVNRLAGDTTRPLLQGAEPVQAISNLLDKRRDVYSAIAHQIDTSEQSPEETAEAVITLWHRQCM